jgi:hypothetical protein
MVLASMIDHRERAGSRENTRPLDRRGTARLDPPLNRADRLVSSC